MFVFKSPCHRLRKYVAGSESSFYPYPFRFPLFIAFCVRKGILFIS